MSAETYWIAERKMRAVTTILVRADSRAEAIRKLQTDEDCEAIDTSYYGEAPARIIRKDGPKRRMRTKQLCWQNPPRRRLRVEQ